MKKLIIVVSIISISIEALILLRIYTIFQKNKIYQEDVILAFAVSISDKYHHHKHMNSIPMMEDEGRIPDGQEAQKQ